MRDIFNAEELDIAKEIINIGLSKAADSLAFFMKEKVFVKRTDLQVKNVAAIQKISQKNKGEELYVLTTELKGELGGICYLILSESEVGALLKTSFPSAILKDPAKLKLMSESLLLEMDNIIVASVITQFSNIFNYKMYGDVPSLSKISPKGLAQMVQSASKTEKSVLHFKSVFISEGMQVNPEFIWLLNDKYIDGVKLIAENQDLLMKMRRTICS
jgi:chemotaxis protein CheY-P-specific phosphatase CheC